MKNKHCYIAYILKRFPRVSETFILYEISALERLGLSIEIFALLKPNEEVTHEVLGKIRARVTYLPWKSEPDLVVPHLASMVRERGVDHLHAHFGTDATTVAMKVSQMTGIPYSFTAHAKDLYDGGVDRVLLKQKILEARFLITVTEHNIEYLTSLAGPALAGKIFRVYNGIDLERFCPDPTVSREPNLILGVSRLVEKKGFRYLLQACRILLHRKQDFKCVLIGEGPERVFLTQQIGSLGLQDCVTLTGAQPQEQVLEMMKRATVLVLPCVISKTGDKDALPTVLLEALAMGLPAISTHLSGIPEIIEHGKTGLLVPPGNPEQLAKAMNEVLSNLQLQGHLSRGGRAKAEAVFDIRKNVLELQNLFTSSTLREREVLGQLS